MSGRGSLSRHCGSSKSDCSPTFEENESSGHGQQLPLIEQTPPLTAAASSYHLCELLLDDPVIEGIKRHLAIGGRVGFEPISGRFARIAFRIKKRMELKLNSYRHFCQDPRNDYAEVVLKTKSGPNECPLGGVILLRDIKTALRALFRRVRKWRSVDFTPFDVYHYDHYHGLVVVPYNPAGEYDCYCHPLSERFVDHLLDALLAESRLTGGIHIRRFKCDGVGELNQRRLTVVLQRLSPNLRLLSIGLKFDRSFESSRRLRHCQPPFLPAFLIEAIGACQQLRLLDIGAGFHRIPPSLHSVLLALPQLIGLRLGHFLWPSSMTAAEPHSLSLAADWLPVGSELAIFQHQQRSTIAAISQPPPLLNRLQCLKVEKGTYSIDPEAFFSDAPTIIAEMRRPARIVIESRFAIDWADIWRACLPLVHSTAASIHVRAGLYTGGGLDVISAEEFAAGVASLPAHVQASLIPPDLSTAPAENDSYSELKFRFHNGGELIVQRGNWQN